MLRRLPIGLAAGAIAAGALLVVFERIAVSEQAAERRALIARNADLTREALAPGSALACLEAEAGQSVAKACEVSVFATPQSVAAATRFVAERLKLIEAAHAFAKKGDGEALAAFAAERRAIERDAFGVAAHVLAGQHGCSPESCMAFAILSDTRMLKADLASQPYEILVTRYERVWDRPAGEQPPPVAAVPVDPLPSAATPSDAPVASVPAHAAEALAKVEPPNAPHPLDRRWKLPSSESIPSVSIMAPEPKLPKGEAAAAPAKTETAAKDAPLPPKRPQAQAPTPEAR